MLYLIKSITDEFFDRLTEDPVRPNIPNDIRVGNNRDVFVLKGEDNSVKAITCVSYQDQIPRTETELFNVDHEPNVAIFYTIWSYKPGAVRDLILTTVNYIKSNKPNINRFITLSPTTEIARRFHLKNGAVVFRDNQETVNYEYVI